MQDSAPALANAGRPSASNNVTDTTEIPSGSKPRTKETPSGSKSQTSETPSGSKPHTPETPSGGKPGMPGKPNKGGSTEAKAEKKRIACIVTDATSVKTAYNATTTSCDALLSLIETAQKWNWANNQNDTRRLKEATHKLAGLATEPDKDFFVHDEDFVEAKYGSEWERPMQMMRSRLWKPMQMLEVETSRHRKKHYVGTSGDRDTAERIPKKKRRQK